jgi:hypothetical protein
MPEPLTVTISHRLGRDKAKRRLDAGLGQVRAQLAPLVSSLTYAWDGYRLDFDITAIRQRVTGTIQVEDDVIRVEIGLPLLLRVLSSVIAARVEGETRLLLSRRTDPS